MRDFIHTANQEMINIKNCDFIMREFEKGEQLPWRIVFHFSEKAAYQEFKTEKERADQLKIIRENYSTNIEEIGKEEDLLSAEYSLEIIPTTDQEADEIALKIFGLGPYLEIFRCHYYENRATKTVKEAYRAVLLLTGKKA
jgi:hypothetical protein